MLCVIEGLNCEKHIRRAWAPGFVEGSQCAVC